MVVMSYRLVGWLVVVELDCVGSLWLACWLKPLSLLLIDGSGGVFRPCVFLLAPCLLPLFSSSFFWAVAVAFCAPFPCSLALCARGRPFHSRCVAFVRATRWLPRFVCVCAK